MSVNHAARETVRGIVRIERELVELYRRTAEHESRSAVGARLSLLEARHLSAASRSERLVEDIRHMEGGGFVSDIGAQVADALVQLITSVPIEFIGEGQIPSIATLRRFEERLRDCYRELAEIIAEPLKGVAEHGLLDSEHNLHELAQLEAR